MIYAFLGWFEWVRVRVHSFAGEKREERRVKRENGFEEMKRNRAKTFYIKRWIGWVLTRSSAPRFRPLDLDPDGSGSILRFWSVLEIRIHQPCGSGPVNAWAFGFLFSFLFFCYVHPCSCYLDPQRALIFSQKFQKNYYVFLVCLWLFFVIFYMLKIDKTDKCKFPFGLIYFVFLVNFLVWFFIQIFAIWF